MQCVLYCDVQGARQFIGEISARGTIDEHFGGSQQRAETREPDVCLRPQPMLVKTGDFAQSIVSATMGIAGEVIQRFELAEDSDVDRGTEGLLPFRPLVQRWTSGGLPINGGVIKVNVRCANRS